MALKLYYDLGSQPSRALYMFLRLNNIPFEKHLISLAEAANRRKEYRKINPFGLVPVIDDNGFILRESVGILRYLAREKKPADHWYPKDSKAQARVDEYLEWQHIGLRLPLTLYFRSVVLDPLLSGKPPDESNVKKLKDAMVKSCNVFEKYWLNDDKKFICGNNLTIADLLATMELEQPRMAGYDPKDGRPKVKEYMDRVRSDTNPVYDEACEAINDIIEALHS